MAKQAAREIVVIIAKSKASDHKKWLFVKDKNGEWSLPIFDMRLFDKHPMIRAVKSCLQLFGDVTNIELSFEMKGEECIAKIYNILFEFDKAFSPIGQYIETRWQHPITFFGSADSDELSCEIIDLMVRAMQSMDGKKATKDMPLEFNIPKK